jgi:hypothetical protein
MCCASRPKPTSASPPECGGRQQFRLPRVTWPSPPSDKSSLNRLASTDEMPPGDGGPAGKPRGAFCLHAPAVRAPRDPVTITSRWPDGAPPTPPLQSIIKEAVAPNLLGAAGFLQPGGGWHGKREARCLLRRRINHCPIVQSEFSGGILAGSLFLDARLRPARHRDHDIDRRLQGDRGIPLRCSDPRRVSAVRARRLCKNAKVIRSLLIYDAMERDLGRIEERLNARDSGYQRVRRPYP